MNKICIQIGPTQVLAQLNDSKTAQAIWDALPVESAFSTWGDEIYFEIPVGEQIERAYAQEIVDAGDLAYWPQGSAFCIFYGPTPASHGSEVRPASAVTVIGKIVGDMTIFKEVDTNHKIIITPNA